MPIVNHRIGASGPLQHTRRLPSPKNHDWTTENIGDCVVKVPVARGAQLIDGLVLHEDGRCTLNTAKALANRYITERHALLSYEHRRKRKTVFGLGEPFSAQTFTANSLAPGHWLTTQFWRFRGSNSIHLMSFNSYVGQIFFDLEQTYRWWFRSPDPLLIPPSNKAALQGFRFVELPTQALGNGAFVSPVGNVLELYASADGEAWVVVDGTNMIGIHDELCLDDEHGMFVRKTAGSDRVIVASKNRHEQVAINVYEPRPRRAGNADFGRFWCRRFAKLVVDPAPVIAPSRAQSKQVKVLQSMRNRPEKSKHVLFGWF